MKQMSYADTTRCLNTLKLCNEMLTLRKHELRVH